MAAGRSSLSFVWVELTHDLLEGEFSVEPHNSNRVEFSGRYASESRLVMLTEIDPRRTSSAYLDLHYVLLVVQLNLADYVEICAFRLDHEKLTHRYRSLKHQVSDVEIMGNHDQV